MPNIHIHTTDDTVAGELVALILAACGSRIRITVDNSDIHDTGSIAARAATETGRRLVLDVMDAERQRRRDTELARAEFFRVQDENYEHHLIVPCPHCHAESRQACVKPSGAAHKRPYVHSVRRHAANVAATAPVAKPRYTAYCVCSHEREAHKGLGRDGVAVTVEPGDHPCEADACTCQHYTAVLPTAVAVPLDEM